MARSTTPTFAHRLQYWLFLMVEKLVRTLPRESAATLGRGLGRGFYRIDARHRRVVRENLRAAGLGLAPEAIEALSRDCFEHFGAMMVATLRQLNASRDELRRTTRLEGQEHIAAAMAEGKGVVAFTGHLGNWELLGLTLSLAGHKLAAVGRELDNPLLEAKLRDIRMRFGNSVIPKDGGVRGSIKAVREGQLVGFLLDQDALGRGIFVRFMGRWASTYSTPAMLAVRFDLPLLPFSSRVLADGTLVVTAHPPFHAPSTGDPARDTWTATQRMTAWIEDRIRENPTQWFWMHRRFKTQPGPGQPGLPPREWLDGAARWIAERPAEAAPADRRDDAAVAG